MARRGKHAAGHRFGHSRRIVPRAPGTGLLDHVGRTVDTDDLNGWLLRGGLAFVFTYAALSAWIDPDALAGYLPAAVPSSWSTTLARVFAAYELVVVIALLTRRYLQAASLVSAATLVVIVVINPTAFGVLFRNVALICAALALAVHPHAVSGRAGATSRRTMAG